MEKYYIVDENGEIKDILDGLESYVVLNYGDKVIRKGSVEYLKETVNLKYNFIKVNSGLPESFYNKHPILLTLMKYAEYMTNILVYSNGKIIKPSDISKICNISESTAKRYIKNMIEDDIIHKVKIDGKTAIMINPFICFKGKRLSLKTYEEFKNSIYVDYCEIRGGK